MTIGYDEIYWEEYLGIPPNECRSDFTVNPNVEFQKWVYQTFNTTIPKTALDIIKYPALYGDIDSPDEFCRWLEDYTKNAFE